MRNLDYERLLLDAHSVVNYVNFYSYIFSYANYILLALLEKYYGVWVDAYT